MTGRVITDPPTDMQGYRTLWRATPTEKATNKQKQVKKKEPLDTCPVCTRSSTDKIADLATRGERPFANIVHEQFALQPPSQKFSETLPNGGRKVLLFADGRQKAARLARDLPREVEFDTFRQALTIAIKRLQSEGEKITIGTKLYAAFVAVCHDQRLHFFDQEFNSQLQFLGHMRKFAREYDAELEDVLSEDEPFGERPMHYRQHLLDQLCNPYYSVYDLGVIVVKPSFSAIKRIRNYLKTIPDLVQTEIELFATFWIHEMLERGAFDVTIPDYVRERALLYSKPPTAGTAFTKLEKVFKQAAPLNDKQLNELRTAFYNVLTEQDQQGQSYLKPSELTLHLAFNDAWYRCNECGSFLHAPLLGRCAVCAGQQLVECPPDAPNIVARYNYYREPLRAVLRGIRPAHITAEEHTAQLSQRDVGQVYATTEEFELRFQDISLSDEQPPVDVLSCTTTMEVGIDIGSLVAIGLRNVPPQRENYQQRAGRAGRRGSAVSTVVTYADNGPHDNFYYHHPESIIAGDPRRPLLKIDRPTLVKRHIYAHLIQTFFHTQTEHLDPDARRQLERKHSTLFTALGSKADFFAEHGDLSFSAFQRWLNVQLTQSSGAVNAILGWLPEPAIPKGKSALTFVQDVAYELINELKSLDHISVEGQTDEKKQKGDLLDLLFDMGLLPTYAFPTDVVSFYIFGFEGQKVIIKERPQQNKSQALSEYAPGRLLVVNKETYRVGGIHTGNLKGSIKQLFDKPLPLYVFCPNCTYVRLEERGNQKHCPICHTSLQVNELLDPPGFSPEKGRSIDERDRDQEFSYALGAQLPLPLSSDQLEWHKGDWPNLQYSYAENRTFVITNRGQEEKGFIICEACGAAWLADSAPQSGAHSRPYLSQYERNTCSGPLHPAPLYLGTTFRSDLLLIRAKLQAPMHYDPTSPWLQDALRTVAEALSLTASRVLDIDPNELSAGYRHLPQEVNGPASFDFYLFDTASGGAGYAAEAGAEINTILEATLETLEGCPRNCQRSCTRCLRHYGNRFWHNGLDRRLAAQLLHHLLYGEVPTMASLPEQRKQLTALQRFLELEGWKILSSSPLSVRYTNRDVTIKTYPALLDSPSLEQGQPTGQSHIYLRDYVVDRDLPAAYIELRQALGM